jgi:predicted RNase H-like HicB family nuclease
VVGRWYAELTADRVSCAERDLAVAREGRAIPARTGPDLMATALPDQLAPMSSEVPNEVEAADHLTATARDFVIMALLGAMTGTTPRPISVSIVYEPVESGWVQARIEGIPQVITAGRTKDEARELVIDALREYLASIGNGDADRERVDLTIAGAD